VECSCIIRIRRFNDLMNGTLHRTAGGIQPMPRPPRTEPRWGSAGSVIRIPRVARSSQPWTGERDPVGVGVVPTMAKCGGLVTREEIAGNHSCQCHHPADSGDQPLAQPANPASGKSARPRRGPPGDHDPRLPHRTRKAAREMPMKRTPIASGSLRRPSNPWGLSLALTGGTLPQRIKGLKGKFEGGRQKLTDYSEGIAV
jgi:hypothetical protein